MFDMGATAKRLKTENARLKEILSILEETVPLECNIATNAVDHLTKLFPHRRVKNG